MSAQTRSRTGFALTETPDYCERLESSYDPKFMFKPRSGDVDKGRDPRRTHTSDALGYAVSELYGPKPVGTGEKDKRLF